MNASRNADPLPGAVGQIPSGLAVLTASHEGCSTGLLTSWIQQASFQPLLLTVCVRIGRPILYLVDGSGRFVLNLLGEDSRGLFKHFGRGFSPDENAFEGLAIAQSSYGINLESALAHVSCAVIDRHPVGDHVLYVGEAVCGGIVRDGRPFVHIRKSGLRY